MFGRLRNALAVAFLAITMLSLPGDRAFAAQASCIMPTTGTVSGLTLVNDINACNGSLLSLYSGAAAPPSPTVGMLWYNTTTNYVQQFDGASWGNLWYIDAVNHQITKAIGGGVTTATMLSASTTDLGSVPQSYITITGSNTINSFGSSADVGTVKNLRFTGSPVLVNSSSLVIPQGATIVMHFGYTASVIYLGGGNWQLISAYVGPQEVPAFSILANATSSFDVYGAINIPTLPLKSSPANSDLILLADMAAGGAFRRATLVSLASLVGVQSIAGLQGNFTLGTCLTNSGTLVLMNCFVFSGAASKADQQAGSSNTVGVTPLHQQDHKSALKVACALEGRIPSVLGGYGCLSISRITAGFYTVNFATSFANTTYTCTATVIGNATAYFGAKATGSITVNTVNLGSSPVGSDNTFDLQCAGDQ